MPNKGLKLRITPQPWDFFVLAVLFLVGFLSSPALAQYSGGPQTATAETTIGTDIFKGGAQNFSTAAASGAAGALSHGTAAKLVFTVTPSATKHFEKFERQPVVVVQDVNGNVVTSDNSTQVSLEILNNPGNGQLKGTATMTVVAGVAQYTDLQINRGGQLYT
ncbi:MAG: hypothetical protein HY591_06435, partial [Candidatus Omnitrophica bacterium]|nr:hypothetical protein [Candidatus Omnitrophota bacterium]